MVLRMSMYDLEKTLQRQEPSQWGAEGLSLVCQQKTTLAAL
jgi:hypothetical protein